MKNYDIRSVQECDSTPDSRKANASQLQKCGCLANYSAPSICGALAPLVGTWHPYKSSKFWDRDMASSDDEEEVADSRSMESTEALVRDAIAEGFCLDDLKSAEVALVNDIPSPNFGSADRGDGHVPHPRSLASRIIKAVAGRRTNNTKPWHGPLPKLRCSSPKKLGDIEVKCSRTCRAAGPRIRLGELFPGGSEDKSEVQTSPLGLKENGGFNTLVDFPELLPFKHDKPKKSWVGPVQFQSKPRLSQVRGFRFSEALGCLFSNAGKPYGSQVKHQSTYSTFSGSPTLEKPSRKAKEGLVSMDIGRIHKARQGSFAGRVGSNGPGWYGQGRARVLVYAQGNMFGSRGQGSDQNFGGRGSWRGRDYNGGIQSQQRSNKPGVAQRILNQRRNYFAWVPKRGGATKSVDTTSDKRSLGKNTKVMNGMEVDGTGGASEVAENDNR